MRHLSVTLQKHSFKNVKKSLDNALPVTYADISEAYWTYRRNEK